MRLWNQPSGRISALATDADAGPLSRAALQERLPAVAAGEVFGDDAVLVIRRTPAHEFTDVLRVVGDSDAWLQLVTARDSFSADIAQRLLRAVDIDDLRRAGALPITIVEGELTPFDCMALVGPKAHDMYRYQDPILGQRTVVAFPAYRCEFSGDEAAEEVRLMRERFVSTLDWKRQPTPKVEMRFVNTRSGARSRGNRFGLVDLPYALHEVVELQGSGGYVDLRNFRREACRVTWTEGRFLMHRHDMAPVRCDHDVDVRGEVLRFLGAPEESSTKCTSPP